LPRVLLISLLALLLLVPATAEGSSGVRLRGTVAAKDAAAHLVSVKSTRTAFALRVRGSLSAIRIGQRVELRGSTLRVHGRGSRVLARDVTIASSQSLPKKTSSPSSGDDRAGDDEREIEGTLTSLAPVTVASKTRSLSCIAPAGMSLAGFAVGDLVEMTCDLVGGAWVVRKLHLEDEDDDDSAARVDDDDDDDHGPGDDDDDDDDDDSSGPGSGDDDHEDDD
jgi:hypothetical protein